MNKIKHYPDVALLLMRLVAGIGFLQSVYPYINFLIKGGGPDVPTWVAIPAAIYLIGGILLILGLYTRWAAAAVVVTTLVIGFMNLPSFGEMTFSLILSFLYYQMSSIIVTLSIFLVGTGKYSLDHKIWHKA